MHPEFDSPTLTAPRQQPPQTARRPAIWPALTAAVDAMARPRTPGTGHQVCEEQLREAAYQERLRITREVHDIISHGLTMINVQASIALHLIDQQPDQAEATLAAIKATSKDTLEELRGTLAVFRQPDADG